MFGSLAKFFKKSLGRRGDPSLNPPSLPQSGEDANRPAVLSAADAESPGVAISEDSAVLPFSAILKNVPQALHGRAGAAALEGLHFSISKQQVLQQLSHGALRVTFGELRQAAPAGAFINNSSHDEKLIDLPFTDVVRQLRPESFVRRHDQKRCEPPDDIGDLFGQKGEPLASMRVMEQSETRKAQTPGVGHSTAAATPVTRATKPATAAAVTPAPRVPFSGPSIASIKRPEPAVAAPAEPIADAEVPDVIPPPAPRIKMRAASPPAARQSEEQEPALLISLAALSAHWPEQIRTEIARQDLEQANCELPLEEVGPALRMGRVQYRWKQIRAWIQPPVSALNRSSFEEINFELPLKVLAPLYLEHCRGARSGKKSSVAEEIPDLFNKNDGTAAKAAPAPKSAAARPKPAAAVAPPPPPAPPAPTPEPAEVCVEVEAPIGDGSEVVESQGEANFLSLPLSLVSETWPEGVRREVDLYNLADAKLEVPCNIIEEGLRQGRLDFRWRQVCRWLRPVPPAGMASANLDTQADFRVSLPLAFVAPLFLQKRSGVGQKKAAAPATIPDLFEAPTANAAKSSIAAAPAPAVSAVEQAPSAPSTAQPASKSAKKAGEQLAALFGEPEKRNWTPNDIVHKTASLPGVAGALLALQDGLLVASCMPPVWKTETIAAFLPQIFGRMNQYAGELKMGELQSVAFSVEEGNLQIFKAGIIYFAALSKSGATLPLAELSLVAQEISRHTK